MVALRCALLANALFGLLLGGCVSRTMPTHLHTDAGRVLDMQRAPGAAVHGIRAEARIDQRGEGGRIRGTVMMFASRPASVRVDAMSQFGPVSILTSDGETFALSSFRDSRFVVGPACARNVARLLRIPMTAEQTVEFLLGGTALIEATERSLRWDAERAAYEITLRAADGHRQVVHMGLREADMDAPLGAQRFDLLRSELYGPAGESLWRVGFSEHRELTTGTHAIRWPYRVHVVQPATDMDTLIRFKKITVNPAIPPTAFSQRPAGGMRIEEASCD